MLVCLPFCQADILDAKRLVSWIGELGGCHGHKCLLIADVDSDWLTALEIQKSAEESFDSVDIICDGEHAAGWVAGGNSKFKAAAMWAQEQGLDFYFNEPDAIPLKSGWLDAIEKEWQEVSKNPETVFMGAIVNHETPNLPSPYGEGNSVYRKDFWKMVGALWSETTSWPFAFCPAIIKFSQQSKLFHHFWGEVGNPPKFSDTNVAGTSVFNLKNIPSEAVVFHRSKGGSLIRLLQRARGISQPMVVVWPVCQSDIGLAITHARWMQQMGKQYPNLAKIVFDATVNISQLTAFRNELQKVFPAIELFKYPVPPVMGWPQAPNWAFQCVARHMAQQDSPWLWMEADCVALVPNWLEKIEDEYYMCGRSWMGAIVKDMGHMNGVGVYPPDAALRSPIMMTCRDRAWDYEMKNEMVHDCHNASHIMQHCWTVVNGEFIETGGGETPANFNAEQCRKWIRKSSVIFHRVKDASLLNLLMRGEYKHE